MAKAIVPAGLMLPNSSLAQRRNWQEMNGKRDRASTETAGETAFLESITNTVQSMDEKQMRRMLETNRHSYTKDWSVLGGERIPRWPSKIGEKRPLNVEITSWVGIGIGAKHYDVRVREEENQWWSEAENAWCTIGCDSGKRGLEASASLLTERDAIKVALYFVELFAGKKRASHEVHWSGPGKPKWAKNEYGDPVGELVTPSDR